MSAARNKGWRAARGSWIQFLDSNDVLARDKIKLQMTVAEKSSRQTAVVYSSWQRVAGEEDQLSPVDEVRTPQVDGKPPASLLIGKNAMQIGSTLMRSEWLEALRGIKEQMHLYENMELLVRIAAAGGGFRFVPSPEPLLLYRMFPDRPRWGDDTARYKLTEVAKTWLALVDRTASNGRIENCGLGAEDREVLIADCTMFLRLLHCHDRSTFNSARRLVPRRFSGHSKSFYERHDPTPPGTFDQVCVMNRGHEFQVSARVMRQRKSAS